MNNKSKWQLLQRQFKQAAVDYPGYESIFVWWPEDDSAPDTDKLPPDLQSNYARAGEGGWTGSHGYAFDHPEQRYRDGVAGMHTQRRQFDKVGAARMYENDADSACIDRMRLFCRQAGDLLSDEQLASSATLIWSGFTSWFIALHEFLPLTTRTFVDHFTYTKVDCVFSASALLIDGWVSNRKRAGGENNEGGWIVRIAKQQIKEALNITRPADWTSFVRGNQSAMRIPSGKNGDLTTANIVDLNLAALSDSDRSAMQKWEKKNR
jgi:hypothetical protein